MLIEYLSLLLMTSFPNKWNTHIVNIVNHSLMFSRSKNYTFFTRGKRVSKVKTLQIAIQYIKELKVLLQQDKEKNRKVCGDIMNFNE